MLPGDPQGLPDESFYKFFKETLVFIDAGFISKLSKNVLIKKTDFENSPLEK